MRCHAECLFLRFFVVVVAQRGDIGNPVALQRIDFHDGQEVCLDAGFSAPINDLNTSEGDDVVIFTDIALDPYSDQGHDGIVRERAGERGSEQGSGGAGASRGKDAWSWGEGEGWEWEGGEGEEGLQGAPDVRSSGVTS